MSDRQSTVAGSPEDVLYTDENMNIHLVSCFPGRELVIMLPLLLAAVAFGEMVLALTPLLPAETIFTRRPWETRQQLQCCWLKVSV